LNARLDNQAECLGDIWSAAIPPEEPCNPGREFILSDRSGIAYQQGDGLGQFDLGDLGDIAAGLGIASGDAD
jgi:hypothetical protein